MGRNVKPKKNMAKEIEKYPIYVLTKHGRLTRICMTSLNEYNHSTMHLHHYIPFQSFVSNPYWYADRNIDQKLILVPIPVHEQLHNQAKKVLSDEDFELEYKIPKSKLIFRK